MKLPQLPALLAGCFLLPLALSAQSVLSVDFNAGTGTPSPTETGFSAVNIGVGNNSSISTTFTGLSTSYTASGSVTLTVTALDSTGAASMFTARDRGTPSTDTGTFTYSNLYRDFVGGTANGGSVVLNFSGLLANTTYSVTFYAYDNAATSSRTMMFTDYTSGSAGTSGSVAYTGSYSFDSTTSNSIFSVTLPVTSDSTGNLVLRDTAGGSGYSAMLNGVQITAIPESATYTAICGALVLAGTIICRRRKN